MENTNNIAWTTKQLVGELNASVPGVVGTYRRFEVTEGSGVRGDAGPINFLSIQVPILHVDSFALMRHPPAKGEGNAHKTVSNPKF